MDQLGTANQGQLALIASAPVGRFSEGLADQGGVVCQTGTCSSVVARVGMGAHRDPAWLPQCPWLPPCQ